MTDQVDHQTILSAAEPYLGPERRRDPRVKTNLYAKLVIGDGFVSPDCAIVDLSLKGARVRISRIVRLPPPVGLLLVRDALLFDAAVAWRRADEAGLVFKGQHDLINDTDPERQSVRTIWAECVTRLYGDDSERVAAPEDEAEL